MTGKKLIPTHVWVIQLNNLIIMFPLLSTYSLEAYFTWISQNGLSAKQRMIVQ